MLSKKLSFILVFIYLLNDVQLSLIYNINSAKIIFYFGPTYNDSQSYDLDNLASLLKHPKFCHNQTNLYMHGFKDSQESYLGHLMVDSYLKGNSINLLTIYWEELTGRNYVSSQINLQKLAPRIADAILKLLQAGLDSNTLSLVGHSLGCYGVGMIGREVFRRSGGSVLLPRITALDPSNPAVHDVFFLPPVSKTDAKFVDVIHTDAGGRGSPQRMGHADFWPNGGVAIQPGCPSQSVNLLCSHLKAHAYWAQSVANVDQEQFLAYHAQNYDDFQENHSNETAVLMGVNCPMSARGDYYLQINSDYGSIPDVGLVL